LWGEVLTAYAYEASPDHETVAARLPLAFLAISYGTGAGPAPAEPGGIRRVRAAAAMLTDRPAQEVGGGTRFWLHGQEPWVTGPRPDASFTAMLSKSPCQPGLMARLADLLGKRRADPLFIDPTAAGILRGITPPFAVAACAGQDQPVIAATDLMGCRHLYWYQGRGWAAVSTSALALARCAAAQPDSQAIAVRAMLGFHLGNSSPFAGIQKLGPAGLCALRRGQVHVTQYASPWPEPARPAGGGAPPDLARRLASLLRSCAAWSVEEFPDAAIELSGGLDSRIQLAAIPPARRAGLHGITLDVAGSTDGFVARRLAGLTGLDHQVLSIAPLADLTPARAWALVRRSAIRHDCSGNPVAHGVLDWAEDQLGTQPRINGAGGETARGFYYPSQRQHPRASDRLTGRLARWRLMTNEAVDARCLGADLAPWARDTAISEVRRVLTGYRRDWLSCTDEFYMRERVVRWAGLRLSASSTERTVLSSMLHPDYVALARACPPALKRNSRFMAMVLSELDANLARIPLDTGYVPARLAAPTVLDQARSCRITGKKLVHKIHQRLASAGQPGAGQCVLSRLVVEHWRSEPQLLLGLPATGLVAGGWLGRLLDRSCQADPATVGYLANLLVMIENTAMGQGDRHFRAGGLSLNPAVA
jgi:asparagine synthase (glutamine-hydrolysing)